MKPLVLRMQAFGPFGQEQLVDFRCLGEKTFFLIHGPTGSGKTSILDAMCFALFGDSSGGEREGRQMRSQHAAPGLLTEVAFEFALGERRYRVQRVPEQMRLARRGGGEARQQPQAELCQLDEDGSERPLAAGWSRVNEQMVRLLGFDSRQFRQVIVLPQGRFFEFLKASSQERERILQVLFGTELYKRIEQGLKDSADALQGQAREVRTQREALLQQAGVESEQALAERRIEQAGRVQACAQAQQAAEAGAVEAEKALAAAREVAGRFREFDEARQEFDRLDAQRPDMARQQGRLEAMRRAAALRPWEEALQQAREALAREQQRAAQREQALAQAGRAQGAAADALALQQQRAPELERLDKRLLELDALRGRVESLAAARAAHRGARERQAVAQAAFESARVAHSTALQQLEQSQQARQVLSAEAAGLEAARLRGEQLLALKQQLAQREALRVRMDEAGAQVQRRTKARDAAREAQARAAEGRRALWARWLAGQAARIARSLREGEACPVCGSHEHPAPAHDQAEAVGDELIAAADEALEQAQSRLLAAEQALGQSQQALATLQGQAETLAETLGAQAPEAALVERQLDETRQVFAGARAAAKELAEQQQALPALQARAQAAEAQVKDTQVAAQQAEGELQRTAGQLSEREQGVPAELASAQRLQAAADGCSREREALREALARAQQGAEAAAQALTRAKALHEESSGACAEREGDAMRRQGEFLQRLRQAGLVEDAAAAHVDSRFRGNDETPVVPAKAGTHAGPSPSDEDLLAAYQRAKADDATLQVLEARLHAFREALGAARERLQRAQAEVGGVGRPALDDLEQAHEHARTAHLAAAQASTQAGAELRATEAYLATIDRLAQRFGQLEQRHNLLRSLADVACGQNAQRMSFQRYVLATLLEEVLAATTLRLRVMSRGRYEMRRRREAGDARAAGGLDLEVFDHYTGSTRGVDTLSGGESFLASLALALGLSDVVQSHAGGIRLDAIFVDEGFGTLDPEALDFAIRTLKDLQQAGRMVGIISHVAELREWMDARLELRPSRAGSRAEFVL